MRRTVFFTGQMTPSRRLNANAMDKFKQPSRSDLPGSPRRGLLIVFEGIDGVGKTTQFQLLGEALRRRGRKVALLREPTDGPHGAAVRAMAATGRFDPQRERELFVADRRENVERNILPALREGAVVLLDRYYFSTIAYQGARGLDPAALRAENEAFAPRPDLLILLDAPVEVGLKRVAEARGGATDAFEQAESLQRVKRIFDSLDDPFLFRVDATQPVQAVARQVLRRVEGLLNERASSKP